MEEHFEIRSYGVAELAVLYQPQVQPNAAVRTLQRWIDRYPGLRQQLMDAGWHSKTKIITPAQVKLIVEALGAP